MFNTLKNYTQQIIGLGLIAGLILGLGVYNSHGTPADAKIFGTTVSATDSCQEPKETQVLKAESSDTMLLVRSMFSKEEADKITGYLLVRGLLIMVSGMEIYRDDARPGEAYMVLYEKLTIDGAVKDCVIQQEDEGVLGDGFWLADVHVNAFLDAIGQLNNGVETLTK
jgi:hypothetical protein